MWTRREKAMLRAIGKEYFTELKNMRYYKANSKERGDTADLNREISRLICLGLAWAAKAAVRAAREVNEPDYKAMWEELKTELNKVIENLSGQAVGNTLEHINAIERRHGGGKV